MTETQATASAKAAGAGEKVSSRGGKETDAPTATVDAPSSPNRPVAGEAEARDSARGNARPHPTAAGGTATGGSVSGSTPAPGDAEGSGQSDGSSSATQGLLTKPDKAPAPAETSGGGQMGAATG